MAFLITWIGKQFYLVYHFSLITNLHKVADISDTYFTDITLVTLILHRIDLLY